jgi:hypothetical protein
MLHQWNFFSPRKWHIVEAKRKKKKRKNAANLLLPYCVSSSSFFSQSSITSLMILHWCAENPSFFHSFFSPPLCSFPSQSSSVRRRRRRRSHPQSTHNLSQLLTQQLQQLQWTKPMSAFRPPSSCFPLQLNFCSQNAERTSLSWSWSVSVSGLLGPPQAPKKVGFSKTSLLMSSKHTHTFSNLFFLQIFFHARLNSSSSSTPTTTKT